MDIPETSLNTSLQDAAEEAVEKVHYYYHLSFSPTWTLTDFITFLISHMYLHNVQHFSLSGQHCGISFHNFDYVFFNVLTFISTYNYMRDRYSQMHNIPLFYPSHRSSFILHMPQKKPVILCIKTLHHIFSLEHHKSPFIFAEIVQVTRFSQWHSYDFILGPAKLPRTTCNDNSDWMSGKQWFFMLLLSGPRPSLSYPPPPTTLQHFQKFAKDLAICLSFHRLHCLIQN